MDGYSGLAVGNLLVLENMWTSLEGELLAGCLRMVSEGVSEKDISNNFINIYPPFCPSIPQPFQKSCLTAMRAGAC